MLTAQQAVCSQAEHEESKTDPEGYGLVSLGEGCGGVFYACPHCPSTLFIPDPDCGRCADTGYVTNPGALHICHCAAGRLIVSSVKEAV